MIKEGLRVLVLESRYFLEGSVGDYDATKSMAWIFSPAKSHPGVQSMLIPKLNMLNSEIMSKLTRKIHQWLGA
jgi:hypothetical protein